MKKHDIVFEAYGSEVSFGALSSGERDIVTLAILDERLGTRSSVILFDTPELHTNPDLVRRRLMALQVDQMAGRS